MESNKYKKWSKSDESQLKYMAKNNFKTTTIAKNLKRTVDAIYNRASDLKISLKPKDK
jgi:hypothetical protein